MAMTFTVFDAGFALNTQGSFVKGFTPLRGGCWSFLQLQVKHASQLEGPTLLQLLCGHTHDALNNTFHILALQPCCLCHCIIGSCGCHCCTLHALHCFHGSHCTH